MGAGTNGAAGMRWAWAVVGAVILGTGIAAHAQAPGNPYSYERASGFEYFTSGTKKGLLKIERVEPNNPQLCVETEYDYDASGNRIRATTRNCAGASGEAVFTTRGSSSAFETKTVTVAGQSVTIPAGAFATTSTNALNQSETKAYDPRFGAVTSLTGPNQLATSWVYDDWGRKTEERRADGTKTLMYYCVVGSTTDALNSSGCHSGNVVAAEAPPDAYAFVYSESRDASGAKMGAFTRAYSDRAGRELRSVTESFDGSGQNKGVIVVDTVYNAQGAKVMATAPYFLGSGSSTVAGSSDRGVTATEYDVLGRPTAIYTIDPKGTRGARSFGTFGSWTYAQQTISYDGLTVTTTNDKDQARKEEKNANGEVVRVTDATGAQLVHQRDAFGNLVATKDALQNIVRIAYDIRGRKVELSDPDAGLSKYGYDALGQLKWQQTAKQTASTKTMMDYDVLGRLTKRVEPEYTSNWVYDNCAKGVGKLCSTSTTHGVSRTTVYDSLGRPETSTTTISSGSGFATGKTFTSKVAYDATTGRVTSQTYPTGVQVGYGYTARGFLETVKLMTAATVKPLPNAQGARAADKVLAAGAVLWTAKQVNAWGKLEQQLYGNGITGTAAFEAATGRVTDLKAGTNDFVQNQSYVWDSLNNLQSRTDHNGDTSNGVSTGAVGETFEYADGLNRLTKYTVNAPAMPGLTRAVELKYNALGMLLSKSDVGNYRYNAQGGAKPHALQSVTYLNGSTTNYTFDANGNLETASAGKYRSVSYTSFNLPDSNSGIQGPAGTSKYTWQYDENHARILETQVTSAGTRTTWNLHPDKQGGLGFESETAPNGTISNRHYISAGGQAIAVLVTTGAITGTAPSVIVKLEYWHKDHLGSLVATTDHEGTVTQRYAYDPFGKRRQVNGTYDEFGNIVVDWSTDRNYGTDRGFTGHEHLDDIGLIHMNGRIFDPALGVFLQPDPMVQEPFDLQNYNRYGYCYNNPLTCTDPSGYSFSLKRFLAGAVIDFFVPGLGSLIMAREVARSKIGYQIGAIAIGIFCGPNPVCNGVLRAGWEALAGHGVEQAIRAGVFAAVSTFVNGQIGDLTSGTPVLNVAAHAAWGCVEGKLQGGSCGAGARAGAVGPLLLDGVGTGNIFVDTMIHAAVGGIASVAGGGKFWQGAQTAAFAYLFNEVVHNVSANRAAGIKFEAAVVDDLIEQGYKVARNVELKFVAASGELTTAIADYMYLKEGEIILGEVKYGLNAKLSAGQKVVYEALIAGKDIGIDSGALERAGISPQAYKTAMARFELVVSELGGRAARQALIKWGFRAVKFASIPIQIGLELATFSKAAE